MLLTRASTFCTRHILVHNHPTVLGRAKSISHPRINADNLNNSDREATQSRNALKFQRQRRTIVILPVQRFGLAQKIFHELFGVAHEV